MACETITIPARGEGAPPLELEARLRRPELTPMVGTAIVAPPHPLYGGSIDNPVVAEISAALVDSGLATLAFNWRGVGRSDGAPSGAAADAVADYLAAASWIARELQAPTVAAGYSFGAVAAVAAAVSGLTVDRLALVALPPSLLGAWDLGAIDASIRVVTGGCDPIAPPGDLERLLEPLPRAELFVIDDADHFFAGPELGRIRGLLVPPHQRHTK